jgi:hypothetical protein
MIKTEDGKYKNYAGIIFDTKEGYLDYIKKISKEWEDCQICKKEHVGTKIFYLFGDDLDKRDMGM